MPFLSGYVGRRAVKDVLAIVKVEHRISPVLIRIVAKREIDRNVMIRGQKSRVKPRIHAENAGKAMWGNSCNAQYTNVALLRYVERKGCQGRIHRSGRARFAAVKVETGGFKTSEIRRVRTLYGVAKCVERFCVFDPS